MIASPNARMTHLALVAVLGIAVMALVAGCGKARTPGTTQSVGTTAIETIPVAQSALATMAPDARLLVLQTAEAVAPTGTPVWGYLFGSPSTDKTYVVYASAGRALGAEQNGTAGLSKDEWAKVPATYDWSVDSDSAYRAAVAVSGAKSTPNAVYMGLLNFKANDDTSTVEPLVWQVYFDPGQSGATKDLITVDAKTGAAAVAK